MLRILVFLLLLPAFDLVAATVDNGRLDDVPQFVLPEMSYDMGLPVVDLPPEPVLVPPAAVRYFSQRNSIFGYVEPLFIAKSWRQPEIRRLR